MYSNAEFAVFGVAGDTDDFSVQRRSIGGDPLPDHVVAQIEFLDELLIHDRNFWRALGVGLRKFAAGNQRYSKSTEVIRAHMRVGIDIESEWESLDPYAGFPECGGVIAGKQSDTR